MSKYYDTAGHAIAASISLSLLDFIAVGLKFWTRRVYNQPLHADDWLLVPATILTIGIAIVVTYGAKHKALGWPLEISNDYQGDPSMLYSDQIILARKAQYAFLMLHPLAVGFTRLSFLLLYKRIFSLDRFRKPLTAIIILVVAWIISFFVAEVFQCSTNWEANWGTTYIFRTQCNKTMWIVFSVCLTGFILDLTILLIPIPFVWQLNLSTGKKIGVISIFLLGSGTVVASLLRFAFLTPHIIRKYSFDHRFIAITTSMYWGMVEAGVGIFVACLATLQQLVRTSVQKQNTRNGTHGSSGGRSVSRSRVFSMAPASRIPKIPVDKTIDVAYAKDSNPILMSSEAWAHQIDRSDEGSNDIELHAGISKPEVGTRYTY